MKQRIHLPNKKYTVEMFEFFKEEWDRFRNQGLGYESTAKKFHLDPLKMESFLRQYRERREELKGAKPPK